MHRHQSCFKHSIRMLSLEVSTIWHMHIGQAMHKGIGNNLKRAYSHLVHNVPFFCWSLRFGIFLRLFCNLCPVSTVVQYPRYPIRADKKIRNCGSSLQVQFLAFALFLLYRTVFYLPCSKQYSITVYLSKG